MGATEDAVEAARAGLGLVARHLRKGSGFRVQGSGFRVQGSGFRE